MEDYGQNTLFGDISDYLVLQDVSWIIIGADSNRGAKKSPVEWATKLIKRARNENVAVWIKDNYGYPETIKEFPRIK